MKIGEVASKTSASQCLRLMHRVGEQASLKVGELQSSLYLFSLNVFFVYITNG